MAYIPTKTEMLPSNIAIVDDRGFPLPTLVFFLLKLEASNKNISGQTTNTVNAITGAGLNADGTYSPNLSSNYLKTATSLYNADMLLDSKLYSVVNRLVSITANYTALVGNYSIMANAASAMITVTLPLASTATTFIVGITKTDSSINAVNIVRSGTDLICGATSQSLLFQNEVLNFVSDGTNWQLAN